ncbi:hypothetical protein T07_8904 [Trichinella nelsoni]|uniref:Uncharacterized protein n=1 Tax=Trichinella nelsoni TaxID=6336 RepID=A0A0V0SC37_9BILA|nr:hypothetical protein T07_8904 [Trichinella nelsoni]
MYNNSADLIRIQLNRLEIDRRGDFEINNYLLSRCCFLRRESRKFARFSKKNYCKPYSKNANHDKCKIM